MKIIDEKKEKSDPVVYMLTSCWVPSLHRAEILVSKILLLDCSHQIRHQRFNLTVSALLSCHESSPTLITVAVAIMAWFRVDKYHDLFVAHERLFCIMVFFFLSGHLFSFNLSLSFC